MIRRKIHAYWREIRWTRRFIIKLTFIHACFTILFHDSRFYFCFLKLFCQSKKHNQNFRFTGPIIFGANEYTSGGNLLWLTASISLYNKSKVSLISKREKYEISEFYLYASCELPDIWKCWCNNYREKR